MLILPAKTYPISAAMNITLTNPTAEGYMSMPWNLSSVPPTSTHNFKAGQTVANAVIATQHPDNSYCADGPTPCLIVGTTNNLYLSSGSAHVLADIYGVFIADEYR